MNEPNADDRILSRDQCETIVKRIRGFTSNEGATVVRLTSWWNGELRWARNRIQMASDRRHVFVYITREFSWGSGTVGTNQFDDVSLEAAVLAAKRRAEPQRKQKSGDIYIQTPDLPIPTVQVWSDETTAITAATRAELARLFSTKAATKDLLAAGYLEMRAGSVATAGDARSIAGGQASKGDPVQMPVNYSAFTQAQCSMTVRQAQGLGSGWAGLSSFDWRTIDGPALAERALQKCLASLNAVRVEPGRYTVILEPQAVSDLMDSFLDAFGREGTEQGSGTFVSEFDESIGLWRSKLGLKVVDDRITISHYAADPEIGVVPVPGQLPITFIEQGVLKTLTYDAPYALPWINEASSNVGYTAGINAFRMSGGPTSMNDMIASTRRGLLVTRFSNVRQLDTTSLVSTGVTRDGLWLIENGVITKAVKNMRFTESPLFVLNQIDQLGPPVPVFRPSRNPALFEQVFTGGGQELTPAIVPPIKANDFSFTALNDAV